MSSFTRVVFVAISLLLGLLRPCFSQENNKVDLRFLSFPRSLEAVELELRLSENKTEPIKAYSHEISQPISVVPPGVWSVGETIKNAEGEEVFVEYGRTAATNSPRQLLLLIRKGTENSDGFDLMALDENGDAFSGGKFLFMNACKVDIAGTVGEEKFMVKPGTHRIIAPKTKSDERHAHAVFYFRKGDEARPFFSSRWPVNERARSMIFFYHDPKNMRIRMHTVRDFR
jgi:hypothetical protein